MTTNSEFFHCDICETNHSDHEGHFESSGLKYCESCAPACAICGDRIENDSRYYDDGDTFIHQACYRRGVDLGIEGDRIRDEIKDRG